MWNKKYTFFNNPLAEKGAIATQDHHRRQMAAVKCLSCHLPSLRRHRCCETVKLL